LVGRYQNPKGRELLFSADHAIEPMAELFFIEVLGCEQGPLPRGYGYPVYPGGRPPSTIRIILQPTNQSLQIFRRVGIVDTGDSRLRKFDYSGSCWVNAEADQIVTIM